ncbi:hypothetical protein CF319_g1095 [Tilletia indica]|nr:hypothetical protein CF319_g1095 [Tilletia indica]
MGPDCGENAAETKQQLALRSQSNGNASEAGNLQLDHEGSTGVGRPDPGMQADRYCSIACGRCSESNDIDTQSKSELVSGGSVGRLREQKRPRVHSCMGSVQRPYSGDDSGVGWICGVWRSLHGGANVQTNLICGTNTICEPTQWIDFQWRSIFSHDSHHHHSQLRAVPGWRTARERRSGFNSHTVSG